MLKGLALGVLTGACLAAGAYRAFAWHRSGESAAPAPSAASSAPAAPAPDPELEGLRAENAKLQSDLAAAKQPASTAGTPATAAKAGPTWKDVGAKIYKLRDQLKNHDELTPEVSELWADFMQLLSEAAKRDGIPVDEAVFGPDGMLGLLLGVLGGSDLPPDAAQQAKLDELGAQLRKDWSRYLGERGDLTAQERGLELIRIAGGARSGMDGVMSAEQRDMMKKLEMFDGVPRMSPQTHFSGDRPSVASQLAGSWQSALKLTDTQAVSLGPIVDEYMRARDAAPTEDRWAAAKRDAELLVAAQKRVRGTLNLSPEQEQALKDWSTAYDYTITDGR